MRIAVTLNPLEGKIPIGNRIMGVSLIKSALKIENEQLFDELFFFEGKKNKKIKPFSFAIYLNDFRLNKEYINISGNVVITITTPCNKIGLTIFNGLIKMKNKGIFKYKSYNLQISNVGLIKEKSIKENVIKCKTLAPIYIKDIEGNSVDIQDKDKFENELNYISNIFLENYRGNGLKERLKFNPIQMKKVVVKEEIESFKNETNKKFMFINSFSGIFELQGNIEDLKILMQSSLGFRRSEGFGVIDLL